MANFGNVNFPLLLNFLRKINVIEPHFAIAFKPMLAVVRILKLNIMRSEVTKKILSETSEQTKEKVINYTNNLIKKK